MDNDNKANKAIEKTVSSKLHYPKRSFSRVKEHP